MRGCANQLERISFRIRELAQIIGVSAEFIRLQIEIGELPAYKLGKCVVIQKEDAMTWISKHKIHSDSNELEGDLSTERDKSTDVDGNAEQSVDA